jgi:hypothetical protein
VEFLAPEPAQQVRIPNELNQVLQEAEEQAVLGGCQANKVTVRTSRPSKLTDNRLLANTTHAFSLPRPRRAVMGGHEFSIRPTALKAEATWLRYIRFLFNYEGFQLSPAYSLARCIVRLLHNRLGPVDDKSRADYKSVYTLCSYRGGM